MTIFRLGTLSMLMLIAACSHSISGAYIAHGQQFVELLQITQSQDGQLLGTLAHTAVKSNGEIERFTLNISGTTDGHEVTLIGKSNEPFSASTNMSGTLDGDSITITQSDGMERFTKSDPNDYLSATQALDSQAAEIKQNIAERQHQQEMAAQEQAQVEAQQRHIAEENQFVASLSDALEHYAANIQAHHDLTPFHAAHEKIIGVAQHYLEIEQGHSHGSVPAAQIDGQIYQLDGRLTQFDIPWDQRVDLGRTHLQEFDNAIAKSPCHTGGDTLSNCSREHDAEAVYRIAKGILQGEMDDIQATIKRDSELMSQIKKAADVSE